MHNSRSMLARLRARKAEIARLREERGATDPILIIAGIAITLILLVGGSFAISGFIGNAHDTNAKGDLDRIATAQAAFRAENDRYGTLAVGPGIVDKSTELQDSSIGFTPTDGNNTRVTTSPRGWTAVTRSASGAIFLRTSESSEIHRLSSEGNYTAWAEVARNYYLDPDASDATTQLGYNYGRPGYSRGNSTVTYSTVPASWSTNGSALRATYTAVGTNAGGPTPSMAGQYRSSTQMTMSYKVYSTRAFTVGAPVVATDVVAVPTTIHASSGTINVPANTPTEIWVTFTVGFPRGVGENEPLLVKPPVSGVVAGQSIEISDLDLYTGVHQPGRSLVSLGSASNSTTRYVSLQQQSLQTIKETRSRILDRPTAVALPSDITWAQVEADATSVSG